MDFWSYLPATAVLLLTGIVWRSMNARLDRMREYIANDLEKKEKIMEEKVNKTECKLTHAPIGESLKRLEANGKILGDKMDAQVEVMNEIKLQLARMNGKGKTA